MFTTGETNKEISNDVGYIPYIPVVLVTLN